MSDRTKQADAPVGTTPSSPVVGAVMAGLLWVIALYLLSYTLLDFGWQQRLSTWNYLVCLGGVAVLAIIMRGYRPDLRRYLGSKAKTADGAADPLNRG